MEKEGRVKGGKKGKGFGKAEMVKGRIGKWGRAMVEVARVG